MQVKRKLFVLVAICCLFPCAAFAHPCCCDYGGVRLAANIVGLVGASLNLLRPAAYVVSQPAVVVQRPVYTSPVYTAPVYTAPVYTAPVYTAPVYTAPVVQPVVVSQPVVIPAPVCVAPRFCPGYGPYYPPCYPCPPPPPPCYPCYPCLYR